MFIIWKWTTHIAGANIARLTKINSRAAGCDPQLLYWYGTRDQTRVRSASFRSCFLFSIARIILWRCRMKWCWIFHALASKTSIFFYSRLEANCNTGPLIMYVYACALACVSHVFVCVECLLLILINSSATVITFLLLWLLLHFNVFLHLAICIKLS